MASEVSVARESSANPLNATGRTRGRSDALTKVGFTEKNGTYERDFGGGVDITLRKQTARNGETEYRYNISNEDKARVGTYTESEAKKLAKKLSGMSNYDARKVIDSYLRDLFDSRKTQTEGDALKHRKKYLGF